MSVVYQNGLGKILDRTIDYISDTIKCLLTKDTYTENKDHIFVSDVVEIDNVTGYTGGFAGSGRQTLGSKAITIDDTNDRVRLTAADASFGTLAAGTTIRGYIAYKHLTSDAASRVISHRKLAVDTPTNGSSITAEYATNDVLRVNC
jgi:hypothetical protein